MMHGKGAPSNCRCSAAGPAADARCRRSQPADHQREIEEPDAAVDVDREWPVPRGMSPKRSPKPAEKDDERRDDHEDDAPGQSAAASARGILKPLLIIKTTSRTRPIAALVNPRRRRFPRSGNPWPLQGRRNILDAAGYAVDSSDRLHRCRTLQPSRVQRPRRRYKIRPIDPEADAHVRMGFDDAGRRARRAGISSGLGDTDADASVATLSRRSPQESARGGGLFRHSPMPAGDEA